MWTRSRLPSVCGGFLIATLIGFTSGSEVDAQGTKGNGDFVVGPDYRVDPDLTDRGNPKGKSFEFFMPLADSRIFRGDELGGRQVFRHQWG